MKPTGPPMITSAEPHGDELHCRLQGDLNIVHAPELRLALADLVKQHKPRTLVLDFAAVKYVDSGALGVLIETRKLTSKQGGTVALAALPKEILGLIKIMKLDTVFEVREAAV
jgi:anti-anti-sigma factor